VTQGPTLEGTVSYECDFVFCTAAGGRRGRLSYSFRVLLGLGYGWSGTVSLLTACRIVERNSNVVVRRRKSLFALAS